MKLLDGYVDEMMAFAGEAEGMFCGRFFEGVAGLPLVRLRFERRLPVGFAIGFAAGTNFVSGGVRGLLDRLFSFLELGGEVRVCGLLGDGWGLFGITNYIRVLLSRDVSALKIDRSNGHP